MCQHRDLVVEGWVCEMVIFEPAELSIGCHHLIGEIERTKSGDSILVYPTGCMYQYKSWCESQLVPGISK